MGRIDDLKNSVGKFTCERCGFSSDIDEFIEEEQTGLIVHPKCADQLSFNEMRVDGPKDSYNHHFNT